MNRFKTVKIDITQKRIIILDTNQADAVNLAAPLQKNNYQIKIFNSAYLAMNSIKKDLPDLIITDIVLPGIDGFEFCRRLKSSSITCDIPVIFYSALDHSNSIVKAFHNGAQDFISKQSDYKEILARIRTHLVEKEKVDNLKHEVEEQKKQLEKFEALDGFISICASCKKVRKKGEDSRKKESWIAIEQFISEHSKALFSHGFCPDCIEELFSELNEDYQKMDLVS